MDEARVLTLDEALDMNQGAMWLQLRYRDKMEVVMYHAEHLPFLIFKGCPGDVRLELRGDQYGISWRCLNYRPKDEGRLILWPDGEGMWKVEEDAG